MSNELAGPPKPPPMPMPLIPMPLPTTPMPFLLVIVFGYEAVETEFPVYDCEVDDCSENALMLLKTPSKLTELSFTGTLTVGYYAKWIIGGAF